MSIIATLSSDCIHRRCIGRDKCFAKKMIQSILACYLFFPVCVCVKSEREKDINILAVTSRSMLSYFPMFHYVRCLYYDAKRCVLLTICWRFFLSSSYFFVSHIFFPLLARSSCIYDPLLEMHYRQIQMFAIAPNIHNTVFFVPFNGILSRLLKYLPIEGYV